LTAEGWWPILDDTNELYKWRGKSLNPTDAAQLIVEVASEELAEDIVMLDLRQITSLADYFVVMTSQSSRQTEGLEIAITSALKDAGVARFHREGIQGAGWVLLDFSNVIVHIFGQEEREFYALERLWYQAQQVVRVQ
jgi:ribosome-associated protein